MGKTERELTTARQPYEVGIARYDELANAHMIGDPFGLLKVLFDQRSLKVVGVHVRRPVHPERMAQVMSQLRPAKPARTGNFGASALRFVPDKLRTLTIDIGGAGIKMLPIDGQGQPLAERRRELTPKPSSPKAVLTVIRKMLGGQGEYDRVSVGFPGVVVRGQVQTAPNLGTKMWHNFDLQNAIQQVTGKPTRVVNDADLQGYGVIRRAGVELVLTLGTGLGSGLYINGHLVPNLELGHHPFRKGKTYEQLVSDKELKRVGKKKWSKRVHDAIEQLEAIFNYDMLHIGGGNAKKLKGRMPLNVKIFDNVQGLAGGVWLWHDTEHARPNKENRPRSGTQTPG